MAQPTRHITPILTVPEIWMRFTLVFQDTLLLLPDLILREGANRTRTTARWPVASPRADNPLVSTGIRPPEAGKQVCPASGLFG